MRTPEWQFALGWNGSRPYLRIEPSTVIKPASIRDRQAGWGSWIVPWYYESNAQIRFEWGFLEIHHIKG